MGGAGEACQSVLMAKCVHFTLFGTMQRSGSSVRAVRSREKGDAMAIVRFRKDEIPPATPEEDAHYRSLMERPDREITDQDNPEVFDFSNWMTVEEFEAYRVAKQQPVASRQ